MHRTFHRRFTLAVAALATSLAVAACGSDDDDAGEAESSTTTAAPGWIPCVNGVAGYTVDQPADWRTNPGDVVPRCSLFDPDPIDVPEGTELPITIAVSIDAENVEASAITRDDRGSDVEARQEEQIAGRAATRLELVATGDGLHRAGLRSTMWVVARSADTSLVFRTYAAGRPDYVEKQQVLDHMARSLRFGPAE